jgi:PmbA protein
MSDNLLNLANDAIKTALTNGADAADAIIVEHVDTNIRFRMGKSETIERAEAKDMGLRVMVKDGDGYKQAIVSSNDISAEALGELAERAVDMARAAPVDPYISQADEYCTDPRNLDLYDSKEPDEKELSNIAEAAEQAALDVDGVTNSEGAEADFGSSTVALATSKGFAQIYNSSSCSVSASVIAGEGLAMETDYDYAVSRHLADLKDPALIGKSAGQRAVARLNSKKIKTCKVPVIFDARVARELLSSFAGAINGVSVAKGTTFLEDKLGEQIFASGINVVDDPHIKRGLASKPFDGEGVTGKKRNIVENGELTTWIMDLRSAKQLGMETTGHASRGTSSPPSPSTTNFYMQAGTQSVEEIMADIKEGVFVTDAFGMGVNSVTGDYSQGAYGFWIESGKKAYPISEITIAGHLLEMFKELTPASDLELRFGVNAPTLRIENMTIAGV